MFIQAKPQADKIVAGDKLIERPDRDFTERQKGAELA